MLRSLLFIKVNARLKKYSVNKCALKKSNQFAKERILTIIFVMHFVTDVLQKIFMIAIQIIVIITKSLNQYRNAVVLCIMSQFVDQMEKYTTITVIWLVTDVNRAHMEDYVEWADFKGVLVTDMVTNMDILVKTNLYLKILTSYYHSYLKILMQFLSLFQKILT